MSYLKRRIVDQSGSSVLLAIAVMMLLGVVGSAFIFRGVTEINSATNYRDGIQALYLAEAGARRALVELSNNSNWVPANPYFEGSGSYLLQITIGTPSTIEAVGTVNKSVRKVVLKVTISSGSGSPPHSIAINSWNYH
ncbi:hypothetical protein [Sporomusa malonica]|uniref:Type 4 fimbrial biogenesis protein PilX N-terminal domain-containing protein n=1 Tax=Sporomusa malonica TaxID=112901 RepID=A0A1W2E9X9_9FIRM|nr:hypothetical protein [Sporomusa malonica]SMD06541.1 hypothetical protein SAMN04488500_12285 [Sporomusa malonica]